MRPKKKKKLNLFFLFSLSNLNIIKKKTNKKTVYELQGPSLEDRDHLKLFRKPWAMTTVMFVGMSFCLPLAHLHEWRAHSEARRQRRKQERERERQQHSSSSSSSMRAPLLEPVQEGSEVVYNGNGGVGSSNGNRGATVSRFRAAAAAELRRAALLSVPTAFDLVATVLMNVGLLSVTASVYQMMRGAEMLFAALFAVVFLRRRLNGWHYGGIACCVAGIALVGAASVFSGEGSQTRAVSQSEMLLGMALIVASQAVQAAQVTFEDHFMSDSGLGIAPLMIVGYEGVIGAGLMLGVMLPLVASLPGTDGDGVHEDSRDTWHVSRSFCFSREREKEREEEGEGKEEEEEKKGHSCFFFSPFDKKIIYKKHTKHKTDDHPLPLDRRDPRRRHDRPHALQRRRDGGHGTPRRRLPHRARDGANAVCLDRRLASLLRRRCGGETRRELVGVVVAAGGGVRGARGRDAGLRARGRGRGG